MVCSVISRRSSHQENDRDTFNGATQIARNYLPVKLGDKEVKKETRISAHESRVTANHKGRPCCSKTGEGGTWVVKQKKGETKDSHNQREKASNTNGEGAAFKYELVAQHQPDQSRDRKALCQKVETSAVAQFPATQSLVIQGQGSPTETPLARRTCARNSGRGKNEFEKRCGRKRGGVEGLGHKPPVSVKPMKEDQQR